MNSEEFTSKWVDAADDFNVAPLSESQYKVFFEDRTGMLLEVNDIEVIENPMTLDVTVILKEN